MPVDPDDLDAIAATVADLYREAETALVRLVSRELARGMDAPTWTADKLGAVGAMRRGAQAILSALTADSSRAIVEAAAAAFRSGWTSALAELPERFFPRSGIGQAARAAAETVPGFAAMEALAVAVHRDIGERSRNILRDVLDGFRETVTAATARTLTGVQTRREAAQAAWSRLTARGMTSFVDRSGRRWQLASYVEMATRTVTQRAAVTGQTDRLDALGVQLVYCSDHVQECALCRPYEGRVLRLDAGPVGDIEVPHQITDAPTTVHVVATLAEAQARGLFHPNCRHSVSAYLPGVTRLPAQPTADRIGDRARQRQRALERAIRAAKVAELAALDDQAARVARRRVRAAQARLRNHLADHPELKRLRYREQIGAGNIPPAGRDDQAGDIGPTVQPELDGGGGAVVRRARREDEPQQPVDDRDARLPGPGQDEIPPEDLTALADDVLEARMAAALGAEQWEEFAALSAESDRRDAERQAREAARTRDRERRQARREAEEERRAQHLEELLAAGVPEEEAVAEAFGVSVERQRRTQAIAQLRAAGFTGAGLDDLARQAYRDEVYRRYLRAEDDTRGNVLTREGTARGIDPMSLFSGSESRARRYASDELKEWWDVHGRLTFAEFRAQLLGDSGALGRLRARGSDSDFRA